MCVCACEIEQTIFFALSSTCYPYDLNAVSVSIPFTVQPVNCMDMWKMQHALIWSVWLFRCSSSSSSSSDSSRIFLRLIFCLFSIFGSLTFYINFYVELCVYMLTIFSTVFNLCSFSFFSQPGMLCPTWHFSSSDTSCRPPLPLFSWNQPVAKR